MAYELVNNKEAWDELRRVLHDLPQGSVYSFDYETLDQLSPYCTGATIRCIGIGITEGRAVCIPFRQEEWESSIPGDFSETLQWLLESFQWVCHNLKMEFGWTAALMGFEPNIIEDTMLIGKDLDENASHSLSNMTKQYTDMGGYDDEMDTYLGDGGTYTDCPLDMLAEYCCGDCDATLRLYKSLLGPHKANTGLRWNYENISIPLAKTLSRMEARGLQLDGDKFLPVYDESLKESASLWDSLGNQSVTKLVARRHKEVKWGGGTNFAKDVMETLGVTPGKGKKKKDGTFGVSYDKKILEPQTDKFPILKDIIRFRELNTFRNNFLHTWWNIRSDDWKIRADWRQADPRSEGKGGTKTGRLSSSPNFQNFPRKGEAKSLLVSRFEDGQLIIADYSNMEKRILAALSGDKAMWEVIDNDLDFHTYTTAGIFGHDYDTLMARIKAGDKEAEDERYKGKTTGFSLDYGSTEWGLSKNLNITLDEARTLINQYWKTYAGLYAWAREVQIKANQTGEVVSPLGRVRRLPGAQSKDKWVRSHAYRQAVNFPSQSAGGELTLWAMIQLDRELPEGSMVVGCVHDSVIIDTKKETLDLTTTLISDIMVDRAFEKFGSWMIKPIPIDVKVGSSWGDAE